MEALTAGRRKGLWVTDRPQREAGEREHTRAFKGKPPSAHLFHAFNLLFSLLRLTYLRTRQTPAGSQDFPR